MFNRFMIWTSTISPAFWESVGIVAFIVFITFTVGVN